MANNGSEKTVSEQLFETYLAEHGFTNFAYEPDVPGTVKRPDYRLVFGSAEAFFEIKELEPASAPLTAGSFDPYPPIREKINEAQKQLRDLKGCMCAVVLSNPRYAFVRLDSMTIYGAMLGRVGITIPFDPATQSFDSDQASQAFLSGGKMVRYKNGKAVALQNTTISAVCVLGCVAEGRRRFAIRIARRKREVGKAWSLRDELYKMFMAAQGTEADPSLYHLRVEVYENPGAVASLARDFGTGRYDERFGATNDGRLCRLFVGSGLQMLEADEREAAVYRGDPLGLR